MNIAYGKISAFAIMIAAFTATTLSTENVEFAAKGLSTISLITNPAEVQLKLDNHTLFGGQYTPTPIEIQLKRGRHVLKISRAGYESQFINLSITSDGPLRMESITLGKNSDYNTAPANFTFSGIDAKISANIDQGFINQKMPFSTNELEADRTHSVDFTVASPTESQSYSCNFKISKNFDQITTVHLTKIKGLLAAKDCTPRGS